MATIDLQNIPKGFGTLPWWIWNGRMEVGEMRRQLRLMKGAGLEAWMLWARFGLEIEYLGHEFMTKVRFAVQESARLGLDVWIYDEFAWPSGNARNHVQEVDPEFRMRVLSAFSYDVAGGGTCLLEPDWGASGFYRDESGHSRPISTYLFPSTDSEANRLYFVPRIERVVAVPVEGGIEQVVRAMNITAGVEDLTVRWTAPAGRWKVRVLLSRDFGSLIDHLNPRAVRTFLDLCHEKYKRYVGDYFGATLKGFFSDETRMFRDTQHRFNEPTIVWTLGMFERLERAGIGNIDATMAAVFSDLQTPDVQALRVPFWNTVTDFYADAFYRQITGWTRANGLVYTGDCFSEDTNSLAYLGDYFKCVSAYDRPGLDALGLPAWAHKELYKSPKFPSSVAHMKGETTRCLCEGPGLLGWGATMEQMRRVTDWLYVFGINALVPNALMYTITHEQLYETPSYFFQWTLWPYYGDWDAYVKRLGYTLTRGRHEVSVAVLYPAQTQFARNQPVRPTAGVRFGEDPSVKTVVDVAYGLLRRQIDFDYIGGDFLDYQDVSSGTITIGQARVNVLVLAGIESLPPKTLQKITDFVKGGGTVLAVGTRDIQSGWVRVESYRDQDDLEEKLERIVSSVAIVPVKIKSPNRKYFAVNLRRDGSAEYLFTVYFGSEPATAGIKVDGWSGFERCDLVTGTWHPAGGDRLEFSPFESVLLRKAGPASAVEKQTLAVTGPWRVRVLDDNLFVPEPLTVTSRWLDRRAWEAMLRYTIECSFEIAEPLKRCRLVMDEVDYFVECGRLRVFVNDQPAPMIPSPILDPGMTAGDLAAALKVGRNFLRIEVDHSDYDSQTLLMLKRRSPMPLVRPRLFGAFRVDNRILYALSDELEVPEGADLTLRGLELYSGRMMYRQTFNLDQPATVTGASIDQLADHAVVRIDGRPLGKILWRPFRLDGRMELAAGEHELEIEVTNTQGNQMFESPMPVGHLAGVRLELE